MPGTALIVAIMNANSLQQRFNDDWTREGETSILKRC